MAKTPTIQNSSVTRKEYKYSLQGVELNFTLRNDNTDELIKFQMLLSSAIADVQKDIKKIVDERKKK